MTYDFHIHDAIRVEYRISTEGPAFPRGFAQIQQENQVVGGNGAISALALAAWGAKVRLTGNILGDDAHGRFLRERLMGVENLHYLPVFSPSQKTPYAVLIRAGHFEAGTLLSPQASHLMLSRLPRDPSVAHYFMGATDAWGDTGEIVLGADSQDYSSLVGSLCNVAAVYLNLMGRSWPQEMKTAFCQIVETIFRERFNCKNSIPTLEEVEAFLHIKR